MQIKSPVRYALIALLFSLLNSGYQALKCQDIHFTQFDFAPLFINPANTGNFNGDMRISGNFRNQWKGSVNPFRTSLVSFDKQFFIFNNKIGLGAFFLNDESGVGGITFNKLYASLGYNTIISNNGIGIGLQAGYAFGKINSWGIYDPLTGTHTAPSGEPIDNLKSSYLDINFGVNYKRSIGIFHPEIGLSVLHLNKPTKSFLDDKEGKESFRYIAYTTIKTNITDKIYAAPKVMISGQSGNFENLLGAEAGYNLIGIKSTVKKVFGGAYVRSNTTGLDAFMAQVGASISRIDIALSYDMYLSSINKSGNMSAFEITFVYKSISTILNSYSIPCERY